MHTLTVLLIEDDHIETLKFKKLLEGINARHKVLNAQNGEEALDVLKEATALPNLILLDLNMPKMNGLEFLTTLKSETALRCIPVVIFTTSNYPGDIQKCYEIGAAGYVMKPLKYKDYKICVENMMNYWENNEFVRK